MIFSLEALQAYHGDSLLLHGGTAEKPVLVLIDGGPSGIYETVLAPRLEELRAERAPDGALRIDLAMVSHIDDDHVHGMVDLGAALVELHDDQQALPYDVRVLWHNAFDDIIGNEADEVSAAAVEVLSEPVGDPRADEIRAAGLAVAASVGQGRELRDQADTLGWAVNTPFDGPVVLPQEGRRTIKLGGDMTLTVVCPHAKQLDNLRKAWDKWLKTHSKAVAKDKAETAAYLDNSPYNLSSIVVLAEAGGKTMLLTGDARGDHILAGLDETKIARDGQTKVDVLKLPHHGSIRNLEPEFFERITADHYVISADGRDGNPETETLETIADVRKDDDFAIHLTNHGRKGNLAKRLDTFLAAKEKSERRYGVNIREDPARSIRIDLLDGS